MLVSGLGEVVCAVGGAPVEGGWEIGFVGEIGVREGTFTAKKKIDVEFVELICEGRARG